tara:strand:+ start:662 stop:793 length:132 start_codon:yes stop_codon:yes gene_type:complete
MIASCHHESWFCRKVQKTASQKTAKMQDHDNLCDLVDGQMGVM